MVCIRERIRFTISAHGDVVKLTPVPGQTLPNFGGMVRGEIELANLTPEAIENWTAQKEALAEVTLPTPV